MVGVIALGRWARLRWALLAVAVVVAGGLALEVVGELLSDNQPADWVDPVLIAASGVVACAILGWLERSRMRPK